MTAVAGCVSLRLDGAFQRIRGWWNKDEVARAEEETRMTQAERDIAEEDYEARKDDVATRSGLLGGGAADYEPPRP